MKRGGRFSQGFRPGLQFYDQDSKSHHGFSPGLDSRGVKDGRLRPPQMPDARRDDLPRVDRHDCRGVSVPFAVEIAG